MGLSASQGRLLMLTARKSDTELRAQQISQQRLVLANQTEQVAKEYADATSNRRLMFRKPSENGFNSVRLTANLIQEYMPTFKIVDANNNIQGSSAFNNSVGDLDLNNPDHLEYALNNGIVFLATVTDDSDGKLEKQSIAGLSQITDEYNTSDDSAAEAKYNLEKTKIQNKDKRLELDLKQVETQHKALETEVESVQKVIQKNIETSFKTFS